MQFSTFFLAAAVLGPAALAVALPQTDEIAGTVPTPDELATLYEDTFPGVLDTFNTMVAGAGGKCPFATNVECTTNCNEILPVTEDVGANAGCLLHCVKSCP